MKSRFSILCLLVNILLISCEQAPQYYEVSGRLHTPYHIKFEHTKPLDKEIDEQLKYFYHLFNAFDSTSVISQVNQNRDIRVDTLFQKVFKKALEVSAETNGAYDVTCAPLINLWGFGFSRKDSVTPAHIDSVRQFIGFQKVRLEGDRIVKDDPRLMMNFSSLADGTVCDMIAQMLEKKGVRNYLLGLLGLIGMNIKNAIVLVDEIGLQLNAGLSPVNAVIEATKTRIVPVTMASGTTILGMLPLLGDAMFAGMAATIMGGLFVSTILTIFVLPVTYCVFFKIKSE